MKLIVAEKPIAAQRIASILGKPKAVKHAGAECYELSDAVVVPLKGHIMNVDFPKQYKGWAATALEELAGAEINYTPTQIFIVKTLEFYAKKCDTVIISTDYDREGESIGKEALSAIKKINPRVTVRRAHFSALTAPEVKAAFSRLVDFDENLADSADARREIDLIWGAVLTRYISLTSGRLGKSFLSAGRVQTPTLALAIDREKEITAFEPKPFWVLSILCDKNGEKFEAVHEEEKIFEKKRAEEISKLKGDSALVKKIEEKKLMQSPPTPFNTTDFLRAAAAIGFQPAKAMEIAERLYMSGSISYPRTDNTVYPPSINISGILKKLERGEFSVLAKKILAQKKIKPTAGEKKATDHPPIHPVAAASKKKLSAAEWKVYELVVRRFLATLAPPAEIETVAAELDFCGENFIARGKTIIFAGWREFYPYLKISEEFLPELREGETVAVDSLNCKEDKTKPKPRYTPAALIKLMSDLNLGTKATRALILQKLIDRGYLQGTKTYAPSHIAFAVTDALEEYAGDITKPDMTAALEKEMDSVERGKKIKSAVVADSRKMLCVILKELQKNRQNISQKLQKALAHDLSVGACPSCNGSLQIISTRRGTRFVGCSNYPRCSTSFPLPAKGKIYILDKKCECCGLPVIKIWYSKYKRFEMCINNRCKSKENWGKGKIVEKENR